MLKLQEMEKVTSDVFLAPALNSDRASGVLPEPLQALLTYLNKAVVSLIALIRYAAHGKSTVVCNLLSIVQNCVTTCLS